MNVKPYCTCHATGTWMLQDGYALDGPSGLWVHSRCRKPSRMNYERNVLGLEQIPQPQRPLVDIYMIERRQEALSLIGEELEWQDDDNEEEWLNYLSD